MEALLNLSLAISILSADVNLNGVVNQLDLTAILASWGQPGPADVNEDGDTNSFDMALVLSAWQWSWGANDAGDGQLWIFQPGSVISVEPSPFFGYQRYMFQGVGGQIMAIDMLIS